MALSRVTERLIRQRGVTPLMYQFGETVITTTREVAREPQRQPRLPQKNRSPSDT